MTWYEESRYEVYPDGFDDAVNSDAYMWTLAVERRSRRPDLWCVSDGFCVYQFDGSRLEEPLPSSRSDTFKTATRFPLPVAMQLARRLVNERRVNGLTLAEASAWVAARLAASER